MGVDVVRSPRASFPTFGTQDGPLSPSEPWLCTGSANASRWLSYEQDQGEDTSRGSYLGKYRKRNSRTETQARLAPLKQGGIPHRYRIITEVII